MKFFKFLGFIGICVVLYLIAQKSADAAIIVGAVIILSLLVNKIVKWIKRVLPQKTGVKHKKINRKKWAKTEQYIIDHQYDGDVKPSTNMETFPMPIIVDIPANN